MNLQPEISLSPCRKNLFAFISLFVLVLLAYSNTFNASWHFDDVNNILKNQPLHLTELSMDNIKKTFYASWDGKGKLYRPAACLSFALNYYSGGTDVYGYHMVNLAIHFLASFFLFLFIVETLNLPILKIRYGPDAYAVALFSTVFWALNPIQTQAVTYIVQRMAIMAALFFIMSMYFYLKGKISQRNSSKFIYYLLCFTCGLMAIASKENAVMLPVILLVFDLFLIQGATRKNLIRYAFFLGIILLICLALAWILAGPSIFKPENLISGYRNRGFTLGERLLTEPRVILFYISLLLYPMPNRLCFEHDIILSTGFFTPPSTIISILAMLVLLGITLTAFRKRPFIGFCIIFFFLNHLIEGSIFPVELIFEHRNYLPSMLFFAPIIILLLKGIRFFSNKGIIKGVLWALLVLIPISWGHSTFMRNMVWQTDYRLYLDCVKKYPDLPRPHNNLGSVYGKKNLHLKALEEYMIALSKENKNNLAANAWTHHNIGAIHEKLGDDKMAAFHYEQALRFQPLFLPTHINKGIRLMKNGHYDEAESEFQKAIKGNPRVASGYAALGFLLMARGRTDEAIQNFKKAIQKDPLDPKTMTFLGLAYKLNNQGGKALIHFKKSLALDGNNPLALLYMAELYASRGMAKKKDQAMTRFFNIFDGNPARIRTFTDWMAEDIAPLNNLRLSYRKDLLALLATECQCRSKKYGDLADTLKKKGEPPFMPVHPLE